MRSDTVLGLVGDSDGGDGGNDADRDGCDARGGNGGGSDCNGVHIGAVVLIAMD